MKASIAAGSFVAGVVMACAPAQVPVNPPSSIRVEPESVVLVGRLARQQILVTELGGDREIDRTRDAKVTADDPSVVAPRSGGVLEPLRSGTTSVTVRVADRAIRIPVTVAIAEP